MSREALVLLVCCCDFRDGAERLIPSKSLRNAVIRAFPGLFCILRMCAPRRAAAVVRPRERKKSADRRRRILISRLLIIRASVPRRKSPFPAYFKGFPVVSPLIPPYPAFLKYPVSPQLQYNVWYYMLSKDEKFINAVIDRYRELRQGILSDEYLCAYIDDVTAWLGDAVERNFSVWGYTLEKDMLSPAWRNPHSHAAAVAQMKRFCIERGAWMDENIDILRQYSHESKNKKFNH